MSFQLKALNIVCSHTELSKIPDGKVLINTINAHSFNVAQKDEVFAEALSITENGKWGIENGRQEKKKKKKTIQ